MASSSQINRLLPTLQLWNHPFLFEYDAALDIKPFISSLRYRNDRQITPYTSSPASRTSSNANGTYSPTLPSPRATPQAPSAANLSAPREAEHTDASEESCKLMYSYPEPSNSSCTSGCPSMSGCIRKCCTGCTLLQHSQHQTVSNCNTNVKAFHPSWINCAPTSKDFPETGSLMV